MSIIQVVSSGKEKNLISRPLGRDHITRRKSKLPQHPLDSRSISGSVKSL